MRWGTRPAIGPLPRARRPASSAVWPYAAALALTLLGGGVLWIAAEPAWRQSAGGWAAQPARSDTTPLPDETPAQASQAPTTPSSSPAEPQPAGGATVAAARPAASDDAAPAAAADVAAPFAPDVAPPSAPPPAGETVALEPPSVPEPAIVEPVEPPVAQAPVATTAAAEPAPAQVAPAEVVPMTATPDPTGTPAPEVTGSLDLPDPPPVSVEVPPAESGATPSQAVESASTPVEAAEAGTPAPALPPLPEERPVAAKAASDDGDIATGTVAPKAAQRKPARRAAPKRETRRAAPSRPVAQPAREAARRDDARAETTGRVDASAEAAAPQPPRMRKEPLDGTSGFIDGPIRPLFQ